MNNSKMFRIVFIFFLVSIFFSGVFAYESVLDVKISVEKESDVVRLEGIERSTGTVTVGIEPVSSDANILKVVIFGGGKELSSVFVKPSFVIFDSEDPLLDKTTMSVSLPWDVNANSLVVERNGLVVASYSFGCSGSSCVSLSNDVYRFDEYSFLREKLLESDNNNDVFSSFSLFVDSMYKDLSFERRSRVLNITLLLQSDENLRERTASVLLSMFSKEPDSVMRSRIAYALGIFGLSQNNDVFIALGKALHDDPSSDVRKASAVSLSMFGGSTVRQMIRDLSLSAVCFNKQGKIFSIQSPIITSQDVTLKFFVESSVQELGVLLWDGSQWVSVASPLERGQLSVVLAHSDVYDLSRGFLLSYDGSIVGDGGRIFYSVSNAVPLPLMGPNVCIPEVVGSLNVRGSISPVVAGDKSLVISYNNIESLKVPLQKVASSTVYQTPQELKILDRSCEYCSKNEYVDGGDVDVSVPGTSSTTVKEKK